MLYIMFFIVLLIPVAPKTTQICTEMLKIPLNLIQMNNTTAKAEKCKNHKLLTLNRRKVYLPRKKKSNKSLHYKIKVPHATL